MKVIGLTGSIGSGKTTVLKMFQTLGIPVYIADIEAKKLMQTLGIIKYELLANFGKSTFKNGLLNTSYLAEIVFSDAQKLKVLNQIVHPKVRAHFLQYKSQLNADYIIFENAILFENGFYNLCDYIITVTVPLEERIKRVQLRDGLDTNQILKRMQHQWSDEEKIKKSDFVIENITIDETQKKVLEIHEKLLKYIHNSNN